MADQDTKTPQPQQATQRTVKSKQTKHETFVRLAERRTQGALEALSHLAQLGDGKSREYAEAEAEAICAALEAGVKDTRERLTARFRKDATFTLGGG